MTTRITCPVWVFVLILGCSSNEGGDLFDDPAATSGGATTGAAAHSSSGTVTSTSETAGTVESSVESATATSSSISTTGSTDGGTDSSSSSTTGSASSDDTASTGSGGTGGATSSDSTTSTTSDSSTSGGEPILETLEYTQDEDCVELQCPEEAPYLVACDITFSSFDDEYFCVALEAEGAVFIKSGDSCDGSVINQGSTITCSSEPLDGEISAEECVTNKAELDVVSDRCDCDAASEIDEC